MRGGGSSQKSEVSSQNIVDLKDIKKSFKQPKGDRVEVLKGIDFALKPAEIAAIVGPSGSGKSTLLQIIGLMEKPDQGHVELLGRRINGLPEASCDKLRRKTINFLFQFDSLLEELTVRENMELALQIKSGGAGAKIEPYAKRLNIASKLSNYPRDLSSGEKTRANILRSLLGEPQLLLADEPTGNLDPKNARQVADEFIALVKDSSGRDRKPMGIIMVTHNIEMANLADSVYQLHEGRLMKEGKQGGRL